MRRVTLLLVAIILSSCRPAPQTVEVLPTTPPLSACGAYTLSASAQGDLVVITAAHDQTLPAMTFQAGKLTDGSDLIVEGSVQLASPKPGRWCASGEMIQGDPCIREWVASKGCLDAPP